MQTTGTEIARLLGVDLVNDAVISAPVPLSDIDDGAITFCRTWSDQVAEAAAAHPGAIIVAPLDAPELPNVVRVANPRLDFSRAVTEFLTPRKAPQIAPTAVVADDAVIGERAWIGNFVVIESGVVVGDDAYLDHAVVLHEGVRVGNHVRIGSHTSIGGPGFGFERDDDGEPLRMPHSGGVVIGDHVEIGSHCSIAQGTMRPTVLEDHVKVDDCCFLAHNVHVGRSSYVIAGAEVSGGVTIGERVWVAPEAAIINKATIGDDATVGIGAVVVKNVERGDIVAGVPAKKIRNIFEQ